MNSELKPFEIIEEDEKSAGSSKRSIKKTVKLKTAYEMSNLNPEKWRLLFTGCANIDALLQGGFPVRGITEISGQSGIGKTQLCLQLALTVQYPLEMGGLAAGAVYISTEGAFPSKRLQELSSGFPARIPSSIDLNFTNNIFIEQAMDQTELDVCIHSRLPQLISQQNIGIIIIDSVAAIFRSSYDADAMKERSRDIRLITSKLHEISNTHNIAIICVNQVTADVANNSGDIPALGLIWQSCVTTSVELFRRNSGTRSMRVSKASYLAKKCCTYEICKDGIQ